MRKPELAILERVRAALEGVLDRKSVCKSADVWRALRSDKNRTIVNREVESKVDYIIVRKGDEKKILDNFGRDNLSLVKQLSHVNIYVKTQ